MSVYVLDDFSASEVVQTNGLLIVYTKRID